ncbi:MAG: hypothetical protein M3N22_01660 [Acidobacteriota bacterium]|nr:hypothetical protein [Acidobacteriota bacterium]
MKIETILRSVALAAALATALPALSKPVNKTISISQNSKVGKSELRAGEYNLLIDGTKATVVKNRKTVAETEGRWEERDSKSMYDSVLLGEGGQVKEIRFSGQKRVFVLND